MAIRMPSSIGPAAAGAVQGLASGFDIGLRLNQAQELSLLRGLQIAQAQRDLEREGLLQSALPKVMGATGQPMELAPARTDLNYLAANAPGYDPEAPPTAVASPAVMTPPMLTMGQLAQTLTPPELAAVSMDPRGAAALKAKGVMTDLEASELVRKRKAVVTAGELASKAIQARRDGDVQNWLLNLASAHRTLGEAVDAEHYGAQLKYADEAMTKLTEHLKKKEEDALARQDVSEQMQAIADYNHDRRTWPVLLERLSRATRSELGLKQALADLSQFRQDLVKDIRSEPQRRFADAVTARLLKPGSREDPATAVGAVLTADPLLRAQVLGAVVTGEMKLPDAWAEGVFGAKVPKDIYEEATANLRARQLVPGTPEFALGFSSEVTRLTTERHKAPLAADAVRRLNDQMARLVDRERLLSTELNNARRTGDDVGEQVARDELSRVRQQQIEIQQQLADTGAGPTPPPPPPKRLRPLSGPPKGKTGAALQEHAVATLQDAIKNQGYSRAEAIAAMRKAGWDVQ